MEWSQEQTIELIEIYKKHEILWNPSHPEHFNKLTKQNVWKEIAKYVGRSVDDIKKKMEYLLAALRREKMKMKRSTGSGKGMFSNKYFHDHHTKINYHFIQTTLQNTIALLS